MSLLISFLLCFISMPLVIKASKRFTSPIKPELGEHAKKAGTPAFGSIAIVFSLIISISLFLSKEQRDIFLPAIIIFFLIGFIDDFLKVKRTSSDGLKSISKLILQSLGAIVISYLIREQGYYINFNSYIYYPLSVFLIIFFVNGVNITDGLDSLAVKSAIPPLVMITLCFSSLKAVSLIVISVYVAFLFYNCPKASIFMGDGGSHILGATLASLALLSQRPIIVTISCGVFALELLSSFIQIFSIRVFKKKVFSIAPLHHALEKKGMNEEKICDRAACLSFFFSIFSATLLKGLL